MSMFRRISSELQCSEALGQNFNVWNYKVALPMLGRIGAKSQSLTG